MSSCVGGQVRWTIGASPLDARDVRREAVRWLTDAGVSKADAADLVISEPLANAVRSAHGAVSLEVSLIDGQVQIAVTDDGPGLFALPGATLPPPEAEGSRGLFLVRQLSSDLEFAADPEGFTVRCWVPIYGDLVC